jgi:hypothetical protein
LNLHDIRPFNGIYFLIRQMISFKIWRHKENTFRTRTVVTMPSKKELKEWRSLVADNTAKDATIGTLAADNTAKAAPDNTAKDATIAAKTLSSKT